MEAQQSTRPVSGGVFWKATNMGSYASCLPHQTAEAAGAWELTDSPPSTSPAHLLHELASDDVAATGKGRQLNHLLQPARGRGGAGGDTSKGGKAMTRGACPPQAAGWQAAGASEAA